MHLKKRAVSLLLGLVLVMQLSAQTQEAQQVPEIEQSIIEPPVPGGSTIIGNVESSGQEVQKPIKKKRKKRKKYVYLRTPACLKRKGPGFIWDLVKDAFLLNVNLFSWDTYKIVVGMFPFFIGARMVDRRIQDHFFCHESFKNCNQLPHWCHEVVRFGLSIPIVALGSQAFLSHDPDWAITGRILLIGMPFVIFGKDLFKRIEFECSLRPWHDHFCKDGKRHGGGFPSGHMAEIMYMTVLYGMRFGPKIAIPLSIYATVLGTIFINCNRHYLSQLIAGGVLGAVYACAASRLVDSKLANNMCISLATDSQGAPGLNISYDF